MWVGDIQLVLAVGLSLSFDLGGTSSLDRSCPTHTHTQTRWEIRIQFSEEKNQMRRFNLNSPIEQRHHLDYNLT